ncbi:MAG: oligosaccharide flippase family protein [Phycisphaerae bacterium]|nr:oligosaccharide flippase family protein [Phycisphaerae bacterium]
MSFTPPTPPVNQASPTMPAEPWSPDEPAPAHLSAPSSSGPAAGQDEAHIARQTARGMAWLMAQTLGYKVISLFGTIYLTKLITPEHLGQMTLALGVAAFTNFLQQPGLREVLVQRRTRVRGWDHPAFSLSVVLGLAATALTAAAAPASLRWWHSDVVLHLLLILSVAAPFFGLAIVPEAKLQCELRFRGLAIIEFARGTGLLLTQIALAFWMKHAGHTDWGAYALAAPVPVFAALRCGAMWWAARPRVRWTPRVQLWRLLGADSAKLFLSSLLGLCISQGAIFALGFYATEDVVGLYSFAFNLSLITAVMLTQNIAAVIFPVLSTMQDDPARLRRTFLSSGRMLNLIAVPACFLQGALAEPFIATVCNPKWAGSIPVMQVLSIAMAFVVIWPSSKSLMQARGRFGLALFMHALHATLYVAAVWLTARATGGHGVAVAWAVTGVYVFIGLADPYVAVRTLDAHTPGEHGPLRDVMGLFAVPMVVGLVGVAGVYAALVQVPYLRTHLVAQGAAVILCSGAACLGLYRVLAPREFARGLEMARSMKARLKV